MKKKKYQREIVQRFYPLLDFSVFQQQFYEYGLAVQSLCFLLDFVYQHNPFLVDKINEPIFQNISERLMLANHSLQQLNIVDDNTFYGKYSSVLKMLNVCITSMGKRQFQSILLNPTSNNEKLQQDYDITDYLLQNNYTYSDLYCKLENIHDISKWCRQIILKKVSPKVFFQLVDNIDTIQEMYSFIQQDTRLYEYLSSHNNITDLNISESCNNISEFVNSNLNLDICKDIDDIRTAEVNFIQPGICEKLDGIVQQSIEEIDLLEAIQKYLNDTIGANEKKTKNTDYIKQHETEKTCIHLITTKRRCTILKQALPHGDVIIRFTSSYNHESYSVTIKDLKSKISFPTQSGNNNFIICPEFSEVYRKVTGYKRQIKEEVANIYDKFLEKMKDWLGGLESLSQFVMCIDMLYARTSIVKKYNLCKPYIDDTAKKAFIDVKNIRHCLIENLNSEELYIANDIILGKEDTQDGILLYGTNAVGKTSLIRAIGIAVIMAQAGFYVAASTFHYKPYTSIFTRILGNDNIFKGLSTFAVEMSELRNILLIADENSLILGDELCSGTESISAQSIFVSGLQHLHSAQSSFIFATHLHEIVKYSEIVDMTRLVLKHMVVIYDRQNDTLIYDRKLKDGSGTNTYGLEVCKSLNLPDAFMENAHTIRRKYYPETASVLSFKSSHFNGKKIMGLCEHCGENIGTEVHHLQHQTRANKKGLITQRDGTQIHKNLLSNLITLCEKCHHSIHNEGIEHKKN